MGGAKGCSDDCAAAIIFITNIVLLLGSLITLTLVIYVWVTQANLIEGQTALSVYVPEFILVIAIILAVIIVAISLLGIISTCTQMKANKEQADKDSGKKTDVSQLDDDVPKDEKEKALKKKTCCFNCGLTIYILLCIIGFVTLLAIGIVSGTYSDKLTSFNTLDAVRDQGDKWLDILEQQVEKQVLSLADKYPKTWNSTQSAFGCCGWSLNKTVVTNATWSSDDLNSATVIGYTASKCCKDSNAVTSVDLIGQYKFDIDGCWKDGKEKVYTCQGAVASYISSNLVKTAIGAIVVAIVMLTLAVCGIVVRYPKYCKCCWKPPKESKNAVAPHRHGTTAETPVQQII